MNLDGDVNQPVPNEVKFGDRDSALAYAKKLGDFGYMASVVRKPPYWVVKYKQKQEKLSLFNRLLMIP